MAVTVNRGLRAGERQRVGEIPFVAWAIDANVLGPRLHPKGVEQAVVIVRIAVQLVDRDVQLVGALDEIEALDREARFGVADHAHGFQLFDAGVRAVAADAFRVEQPDPDDEVVDR